MKHQKIQKKRNVWSSVEAAQRTTGLSWPVKRYLIPETINVHKLPKEFLWNEGTLLNQVSVGIYGRIDGGYNEHKL